MCLQPTSPPLAKGELITLVLWCWQSVAECSVLIHRVCVCSVQNMYMSIDDVDVCLLDRTCKVCIIIITIIFVRLQRAPLCKQLR